MVLDNTQKEFNPDELFEEEFDIVPAGKGSAKPASPHAAIWQFVTIVLCSTLAFFIGRLNFLSDQKPSIRIEQQASVVNVENENLPETPATAPKVQAAPVPPPASVKSSPSTTPIPGGYVASKSGEKYFLPWCGSASRIKEENKIWFATKADAEKAGYTPAANCPGL